MQQLAFTLRVGAAVALVAVAAVHIPEHKKEQQRISGGHLY